MSLTALRHALGDRVRTGEVLAPYTTFRIGGPADLFYEPQSADELAAALLAARRLGVPYFLLGLGANILIGDKGFRGLVIRNQARGIEIFPETGQVRAESGAVVYPDLID
ncbi:MAG TPA: FAD-binding protein, partial [Thermoanaerobaculia bacterium]|nr:FAD-binding protein [Thermoanaerobaculia bacterium]